MYLCFPRIFQFDYRSLKGFIGLDFLVFLVHDVHCVRAYSLIAWLHGYKFSTYTNGLFVVPMLNDSEHIGFRDF